LIGGDWRGVDLKELIESQLGHILPEQRERITIEGPPVVVTPEAGQYLALCLHELATNAIKHGVLGPAAGELKILWTTTPTEEGARSVTLNWLEEGAAPETSEHSGFGRILLETLAPRALKGVVRRTLDAHGLKWIISFGDAGAAFQRT